jgi:hypothetical protein
VSGILRSSGFKLLVEISFLTRNSIGKTTKKVNIVSIIKKLKIIENFLLAGISS